MEDFLKLAVSIRGALAPLLDHRLLTQLITAPLLLTLQPDRSLLEPFTQNLDHSQTDIRTVTQERLKAFLVDTQCVDVSHCGQGGAARFLADERHLADILAWFAPGQLDLFLIFRC